VGVQYFVMSSSNMSLIVLIGCTAVNGANTVHGRSDAERKELARHVFALRVRPRQQFIKLL
jgi:hypothetical protein